MRISAIAPALAVTILAASGLAAAAGNGNGNGNGNGQAHAAHGIGNIHNLNNLIAPGLLNNAAVAEVIRGNGNGAVAEVVRANGAMADVVRGNSGMADVIRGNGSHGLGRNAIDVPVLEAGKAIGRKPIAGKLDVMAKTDRGESDAAGAPAETGTESTAAQQPVARARAPLPSCN
jgi:hypothetical protein